MDSIQLLVVDDATESLSRVEKIVSVEGLPLRVSHGTWDALPTVQERDFGILLLRVHREDGDASGAFQAIRRGYVGVPIQIVGVADDEADYGRIVEMGADDVVAWIASDVEIAARLRAAGFRLAEQVRMLREREFLRRAVRDEEEVSARILDRNRLLTDACRSLDSMRRELEQTNLQLQRLSRFDMLSGVLNRPTLFSTMDMEIERSLRLGMPLSGFMTDIDNFKDINDNWGHPSGDEVIRSFGTRLSGSLRKYDHAGRYGGEEFFVILPNAPLAQAEAIAERFRTSLKAAPITIGNEDLVVTASTGVAQFRATEPRDAWVTRADQAMYLAKQQGRDRVCTIR